MQEAYLASFLRTVFIIFAIIIVIRFITRVFMPYILKYLVKKSEDHINKKFQEFNNQQNTYNQSSSNSSAHNASKPKEKKKVGEYIDFEEID